MENLKKRYKLVGLGIENFRIFKDFQFFNIKPITLLTGTNSAGKSTFGKALLMLKQSFETKALNSLVLNSSATNLGSIAHITPYGSEDADPTFVLHIQEESIEPLRDKSQNKVYVLTLVYREGNLYRFSLDINQQLIARATISSQYGMLRFQESYFHYPEQLIEMEKIFDEFYEDAAIFSEIKSEVLQFLRNTDGIHNVSAMDLLPYDKTRDVFSKYVSLCLKEVMDIGAVTMYIDEDNWSMNRDYTLNEVLSNELKSKVVNKALLGKSVAAIVNSEYQFDPLLQADFLSAFQTINNNVLEYNINDIVISKHKYPNIYKSMLSNEFNVGFFYNEVQAIQALLYYWIVTRLKLVKPSSKFKDESFGFSRGKDNKQFIRVINGDEWGELIKIEVFADNQWVPLSSLGFGTANIILKIVQLIKHNNMLIVEEPEANLHPSLQSKLADFIVLTTELKNHHDVRNPFSRPLAEDQQHLVIEGNQINISGATKIIETHSEYFIRRLQFLVASSESPLTEDDVQIYYFNNPLEEDFDPAKQIIDIKIQKNGSLSENFGSGFMDEADNIALELYLLQYK